MFDIKRYDEILLLALDYGKKKSDPRNSTIKILLIVLVTSTSYSDQLRLRKRHSEKVFWLMLLQKVRALQFKV